MLKHTCYIPISVYKCPNLYWIESAKADRKWVVLNGQFVIMYLLNKSEGVVRAEFFFGLHLNLDD